MKCRNLWQLMLVTLCVSGQTAAAPPILNVTLGPVTYGGDSLVELTILAVADGRNRADVKLDGVQGVEVGMPMMVEIDGYVPIFDGEISRIEPPFVSAETTHISGYEFDHRLTRGTESRLWVDDSTKSGADTNQITSELLLLWAEQSNFAITLTDTKLHLKKQNTGKAR